MYNEKENEKMVLEKDKTSLRSDDTQGVDEDIDCNKY